MKRQHAYPSTPERLPRFPTAYRPEPQPPRDPLYGTEDGHAPGFLNETGGLWTDALVCGGAIGFLLWVGAMTGGLQ